MIVTRTIPVTETATMAPSTERTPAIRAKSMASGGPATHATDITAEVSVEEALNRADASMYAVKRQRRAAGEGGNPPPSSQVSAPR